MLDTWGYRYLNIGLHLARMRELLNVKTLVVSGLIQKNPTQIDAKDRIVEKVLSRLATILKDCEREDLSPIPQNIVALQARILEARKNPKKPMLPIAELQNSVEKIKNDFSYILGSRQFYEVPPNLSKYYGNPALFGPKVTRKFSGARYDIERAGNCLALGEPTACVLHLNRVMEIAIHRLARKLGITPDAKDNMGSMLGMTDPIKQLPDKTEAQKRKKEKWAECRTNLYHVKMAWRDPSSHGKQSYDDKEASDIFKRVQDFMQQLATL